MSLDPTTTATEATELSTEAAATATTEPARVTEDLLVEDVSIDGMCGVY